MRDDLSTFKIWAPDKVMWTEWVKPVLFSSIQYSYNRTIIPELNWINEVFSNTMVIVDLPSNEGIEVGLALARVGYRPIPLYNGVKGPISMIVDVTEIQNGLYQGADELEKLNIRVDAPPSFLLDANRMKEDKHQPGKYDNRWCIFPQDMPSSNFLVKENIKKIIVRSSKIQDDLSHILCRYQEKGIKICIVDESGNLKDIKVSKPSRFRSLMYRFKVTLGLTRNAAGGFGGRIPEPTQHHSGTGYYGIG